VPERFDISPLRSHGRRDFENAGGRRIENRPSFISNTERAEGTWTSVTTMRILPFPRRLRIAMAHQTTDHPRTLECELTVEQPQFGRPARLYGHKPRSSVGRRVRQGDRLAHRWTSPNLGLHRNRAVPADNELGSQFRAARYVGRPFVVLVKEVRPCPSAISACLSRAEALALMQAQRGIRAPPSASWSG